MKKRVQREKQRGRTAPSSVRSLTIAPPAPTPVGDGLTDGPSELEPGAFRLPEPNEDVLHAYKMWLDPGETHRVGFDDSGIRLTEDDS